MTTERIVVDGHPAFYYDTLDGVFLEWFNCVEKDGPTYETAQCHSYCQSFVAFGKTKEEALTALNSALAEETVTA
jgi:hypothetical protein